MILILVSPFNVPLGVPDWMLEDLSKEDEERTVCKIQTDGQLGPLSSL